MAFDWNSAITGAGTGAGVGLGIGGPTGALLGGGAGFLSGFFSGDKNPKSISTLDPKQKQLYEQQAQALGGGGGPLADIYGQFNPQLMKDYYQSNFSQPAYQEFQQNIVPEITGAFRGKNLQNSSYLGDSLSKAGTNVQNNLNAQMAKLLYEGQNSQTDRRASALDRILNLQTQVHQSPQASVFDNLIKSLSETAADSLGDYIGKRRTPNTMGSPQSSGIQPSIGG